MSQRTPEISCFHKGGMLKSYHKWKTSLITKWRCFAVTMNTYTSPYQGVMETVTLLCVLIQVKHGLLTQGDSKKRNSEKPSDASIPLIFRKSGPNWCWVNHRKGHRKRSGFPCLTWVPCYLAGILQHTKFNAQEHRKGLKRASKSLPNLMD